MTDHIDPAESPHPADGSYGGWQPEITLLGWWRGIRQALRQRRGQR